jgi:hypothetical protein
LGTKVGTLDGVFELQHAGAPARRRTCPTRRRHEATNSGSSDTAVKIPNIMPIGLSPTQALTTTPWGMAEHLAV